MYFRHSFSFQRCHGLQIRTSVLWPRFVVTQKLHRVDRLERHTTRHRALHVNTIIQVRPEFSLYGKSAQFLFKMRHPIQWKRTFVGFAWDASTVYPALLTAVWLQKKKKKRKKHTPNVWNLSRVFAENTQVRGSPARKMFHTWQNRKCSCRPWTTPWWTEYERRAWGNHQGRHSQTTGPSAMIQKWELSCVAT